jgi:hypothetical protein
MWFYLNIKWLVILLALLVCLSAVLRAEEPGPWYLISEMELRSIEQYKETSEQEKRNWLLQVQGLKQDSANLNDQLAEARAQSRKLETSFNEYEAAQLIRLSLKNGEIADLKQAVAEQTLETEKYKGIAWNRLFIIIALGAAWIIFITFKVLRFFKIIKIQ